MGAIKQHYRFLRYKTYNRYQVLFSNAGDSLPYDSIQKRANSVKDSRAFKTVEWRGEKRTKKNKNEKKEKQCDKQELKHIKRYKKKQEETRKDN